MTTIPFKEVVEVNPDVLSASGAAVDLNGLLLSSNAYIPTGTVLQFASANDVATYFGAASLEASLAPIYFNGYDGCTKKAGALYMALYNTTAVGGFLRSASLSSMTLTQLKALSGTLILTVGGTLFTSSSISLTAATSFSNAATIIQAAFTTPTFTVTYDSIKSAFIFSVTATGATSTITYATGTLSTGLSLTSATGAVLSQGAAIAVPATLMNSIVVQNQNWATFTSTTEFTLADKQAFADWTNSVQPRYAYFGQDSDVTAKTAGSTGTFGAYLKTGQLIGTTPIFGDATHSVFLMGFAAALDFERTNGRTTASFRSQGGLVASVSNESDYKGLIANGYNGYGIFGSNNPANNQNWFFTGSISGKWLWLDSYLNQIWLNANLQLARVNLLRNSPSIPYNSTGYGLIRAADLDPINAAINFGAIRTGVTLSSSQKAEIQFAIGFDVSGVIFAQGFYEQITDASPATRIARGSPPTTLYYTDGQSIQKLVLASIEVQ